MTNLERFCKQLSIQGGTVYQVADKLGIDVEQVLGAEFVKLPKWAQGINYSPRLVSPNGKEVEGVTSGNKMMIKNYLKCGWKWGL